MVIDWVTKFCPEKEHVVIEPEHPKGLEVQSIFLMRTMK